MSEPRPLFLIHKVSYTVSFDGVPPHQREELSRRLTALRRQLRASRPRGTKVDVTLACPAHGIGWLLAVIDGQQYSCEPPDAWWCLLLGWSTPCADGAHTCERGGWAHEVCTRCGAIRRIESECRYRESREAGPWWHVGTDEHAGRVAEIAASALSGARMPLSMFADDGELSWAAGIMQPKPADMSGPEPQVDPDADLPDPPTPAGCCRCDRCEEERAEFVPRHPAEQKARDLRLARWYDTGISYESEDGGPEEDKMRGIAGVRSVDLSLNEAEQQWHLIVLCAPETAREHGWDAS